MSSFNNSNPSSTSSSTKSYKVAYALNPKKLRKSNKSSTSSSNPSDASSTSIEGDPIWQGGGLADVLHFSSFSLHYPIQFIHWEENIQDCKLIIHKLTEEIERSGEGERLSGINLSNLLNNDHNLSESESESESDFPQLSSVSYDSVTSDTSIINDQNDEKKLEAIEKITSISNYIMSMGGRVRLIDSFESVARVTNRLRSTLCIRIIEDIYRRKFSNRLEKSSFYPINSYLSSSNYLPIIQPNFLFINNKIKPKHILKLMKKYSLNFPIICKPTLACSTPTSHLLSIILSYEDLSTIPRPCILQQYLNHSEKFYKIYNIGNNILISKRKSLPDLNLIYLLNDNQSNLNDQINYYENLLNSSLTSLTIHSSVSNLNDLLKNKENSLNTNYLPYLITKSYEINEKNNEKILKYKLLQAKSVTFDSRYTYPSLKNFIVNLSEYSEEEIKEERKNTDNDIVMNDNVKALCEEIAQSFRQTFQLSLFGFDVLIPSELESQVIQSSSINFHPDPLPLSPSNIDEVYSRNYIINNISQENLDSSLPSPYTPPLVVDVNYFPSYKEVPNFPMLLRRHLVSLSDEINQINEN